MSWVEPSAKKLWKERREDFVKIFLMSIGVFLLYTWGWRHMDKQRQGNFNWHLILWFNFFQWTTYKREWLTTIDFVFIFHYVCLVCFPLDFWIVLYLCWLMKFCSFWILYKNIYNIYNIYNKNLSIILNR